MRFYAAITSERASKGQGGRWLDIEITNEKREIIMEINITSTSIYATTFGENAQCIDTNEMKPKSEKQKGKPFGLKNTCMYDHDHTAGNCEYHE